MKVFIMVDMEGISGICQSSQVMAGDPNNAAGRQFMTWDVNACVAGCFDGGAEAVVVRDAHAIGFNLLWDLLDGRAEYIQGRPSLDRMPGLAEFDGLMLLGYHAMAGTPDAVLEHTMTSRFWQNFWMNGRRCGELAIDAGIAGDAGVPTILASGDDKLCREAEEFIDGIVAVEVKMGLGCQSARLLPRERAHKRIAEGAARAVAACREGKVRPFKVASPVTMRLELVSRGSVPVGRPDVTVIDGRTYEVSAGTVEQAFRLL